MKYDFFSYIVFLSRERAKFYVASCLILTEHVMSVKGVYDVFEELKFLQVLHLATCCTAESRKKF